MIGAAKMSFQEVSAPLPPFRLTVNTTKPGSAADTFVLPTNSAGTYNYTIDWGDSVVETYVTNTPKTHVYAAPGTYTIQITGTFPQIYFNFWGDCLKLIGLQLGDVGWKLMSSAFAGCENLVSLTGPVNTSAVTDMGNMFTNCTAFNQSVAGFNTAAVTKMSSMFANCTAFNQSVASLNTASVSNMSYMFSGCTAFNQSVASFNTAAATNMYGMFFGCTAFKQSLATFNMAGVSSVDLMCDGCDLNAPGTTANYDATLIAWAAQSLVHGLAMYFGTSEYSAGAAATARGVITGTYGWTITDGEHDAD